MDNFFKIRRKEIIICLFLVAATLSVYLQVINYDFVYFDDELYVIDNPNVKAGLNRESIIWAFSADYAGNWHPLTWLSHMLDVELYGLSPMGHHLTSLQIHIANTVLLFILLNYMTGAVWPSGFVSALFALHPLHVESVVWVAERKDVLCAFFWILSISAYVRYTRNQSKMNYLLLVVLFAFGLMAKPMIVTLPFTLLLLDFWPLSRFKQKTYKTQTSACRIPMALIWEKIPLFALSAISSIITFSIQQHGGAVASLESIPLMMRISNALVSYISYIIKMFWPINLAFFYPYHKLLIWNVLLSGILLLCVSALIIFAARRLPYLVTGWLWYLGTLVPVIGIVQTGCQRMADRYTYVPLIGIFIIIAWGMRDIAAKWQGRRILLPIFSGVALVFFMICTWFQAGHWQNGITIFKHTLDVTKNNCVANCELGHALMRNGKLDEAVIQFCKALKINPNYEEAHANLGCTLARQKKVNDAIYHYQEALRINQNNAKAHNNLGVLLAGKGKVNDAIYHYKEGLRINPKYGGAYYNLGKIYANKGDIENAILFYKKTLQVSPNMAEALYNLSWIYATHKDNKFINGKEAVKLAEKLCRLQNYSHPLSLDVLAAAYAVTGKFDRAVKVAQQGLSVALMHGPEELASALTKRLQLYQAGIPYRQK